ncbi:membrane bound O-acyl transferase family-domain-containing protein [Talaromyces proteolyticus]|uniref:Membrane bound O-acyl transferase family-domain-containing protein n=1 Tax=Talaromyces proteolyticus TaxID=1131652 RepID=A0AAD4PWM9_9EURO|nr:membrane bound O-acyl transferase family-domain-containing protein [Talaromyces proteolyticus]KAH8695275.1 membrane bound O-acyl transferase family-domain-containing protein [Talaromyces proteolyticus]
MIDHLLSISAACIIGLNVLSTLGLLTARTKFTRILISTILLGLTSVFQYTFTTWYQNRMHRGLAASIFWAYLLSSTELLLISDVGFKDAPEPSNGLLSWRNIKWAIFLSWNMRRVGTKWEVKNIPSFSGGRTKSKEVPSATQFIRKRLLIVVLASLFLDAITSGPPPDMEMFSEEKQYLNFARLSQVDLEELITRVILTMTITLNAALPIMITYYVASIILVATGLNTPAELPPLYGPLLECYSVRRFWGLLWHQWLRRSLTGIAASVTTSLSIPRQSNLYRVTSLLIVFAISGCIHQLSDLAIGIPQFEANGFYFFMLQPLAIVFEDAFESLYFRYFRREGGIYGRLRTWEYVICFLWVVLYFTVLAPIWFWPAVRHTDPTRDSFLLVRIVPFK